MDGFCALASGGSGLRASNSVIPRLVAVLGLCYQGEQLIESASGIQRAQARRRALEVSIFAIARAVVHIVVNVGDRSSAHLDAISDVAQS